MSYLSVYVIRALSLVVYVVGTFRQRIIQTNQTWLFVKADFKLIMFDAECHRYMFVL